MTQIRIKSHAIALIVGGSIYAKAEWQEALSLSHGLERTTFAINDMIAEPIGANYGVTMHPEKLPQWGRERRQISDTPLPCIAHKPARGVVAVLPACGGSSGLFAVHAAREAGATRIVLCGVGMDGDHGHFRRGERWKAANVFWPAWEREFDTLWPYVRSFGGRTADLFGRPSRQWLDSASEGDRTVKG